MHNPQLLLPAAKAKDLSPEARRILLQQLLFKLHNKIRPKQIYGDETAPPPPSDLSWWEDNSFLNDHEIRRAMVKEFGEIGFAIVYFPHYLYEEPADFFPELIDKIADPALRFLEIYGFRGSGKSTFASLIDVIYSALELPEQYPFIIPIADTGTQAGINIANIKSELENNQLLLLDYGKMPTNKKVKDGPLEPTLESEEEWQAKNMLLSNGVRILARSRGQKIRGLRHKQHRPRKVICDDVEDTDHVRFKENRDLTEKWLRGEVIPALDQKRGKLVLIGNFLHNDAIMARAEKWGIFTVLRLPLVTDDGFITWPAVFPDQRALDKKRRELGEISYMREMLLKVVPDEGQEVTPDDIHYYNEMPSEGMGNIGHGMDLAISLKASADCTTDVVGKVFYVNGRAKIFIQPNPLNARLDLLSTVDHCKTQVLDGQAHIFFVENVAYQLAAIQLLEANMIPVHPMRPISDKRARLRTSAPHIKNGTVVFPRNGCEELLQQIFGFGTERHDDLVDGLTTLILGLAEFGLELPKVVWI